MSLQQICFQSLASSQRSSLEMKWSDIEISFSPHFVFYICLSVRTSLCWKFAHCFVYSLLNSVHFNLLCVLRSSASEVDLKLCACTLITGEYLNERTRVLIWALTTLSFQEIHRRGFHPLSARKTCTFREPECMHQLNRHGFVLSLWLTPVSL